MGVLPFLIECLQMMLRGIYVLKLLAQRTRLFRPMLSRFEREPTRNCDFQFFPSAATFSETISADELNLLNVRRTLGQ